MPKQVGNTACVLAYLFNSASIQCHEAWTSQFPFLHSVHDTVSLSKTCLYGHIKWPLALAPAVLNLNVNDFSLYEAGKGQAKG